MHRASDNKQEGTALKCLFLPQPVKKSLCHLCLVHASGEAGALKCGHWWPQSRGYGTLGSVALVWVNVPN